MLPNGCSEVLDTFAIRKNNKKLFEKKELQNPPNPYTLDSGHEIFSIDVIFLYKCPLTYFSCVFIRLTELIKQHFG